MIDLDSNDWPYVFQYAGDNDPDKDGYQRSNYGDLSISACLGTETFTGPVKRADVVKVIAFFEGEHDEQNWLIVVQVKDGRYAFISAGCDYTGWDCQAGGHTIVDTDLQHLIRFGIGEDERARLGLEMV